MNRSIAQPVRASVLHTEGREFESLCSYKIGIGITTFNRPKHLVLCLELIKKYTPDCYVYVADDSKERKGIAYRKNECLKVLKDCDYIFLFDDDCFPIKKGWVDYFIDAYKTSGQHHFIYLKETSTIKQIGQNQSINIFDNCGGCFMFLTKEVIQKVGGYNPAYGIYGFEHAGYSNRLHVAGLTPLGAYTCPAGAGEYIYSMDYDFHLPFNKQVKHEPSLKNELHLLADYLKKNKQIYDMDLQIYQPL